MSKINSISASSSVSGKTDKSDEIFNSRVLDYIQQNRPTGDMNEFVKGMKALADGQSKRMVQLSEALMYADIKLRATPGFEEYTTDILNHRSCQLVGVAQFYKSMLENCFNQDKDDSFI